MHRQVDAIGKQPVAVGTTVLGIRLRGSPATIAETVLTGQDNVPAAPTADPPGSGGLINRFFLLLHDEDPCFQKYENPQG
jgi:hypothetical protein